MTARREGLAGDLLHDGDGAFAHQCDGHWMGAHALAREAAGGVGGAPSHKERHRPMIITDLADLGLALVLAIVAIAVVALLGLRRRWRCGRR